MTVYQLPFKTGIIRIDFEKCKSCESYACVKACSLFGASLFRVDNGKPVTISSTEEAGRRCIEDLTCELYCQAYGNQGLKIELDMFGLDAYREKIKLR
ncbi:MAG: hypothetical protein HYY41_02610 [Chloroflexi bacterium]|nr:hypothetical protein [Chloroflexota bacterium]MBI2979704.1 hypothetical protein [Chloroflexota bacterium]